MDPERVDRLEWHRFGRDQRRMYYSNPKRPEMFIALAVML